MQSMKGATQLLGSMNRQMNLPALQRIAMEFEKENDIMDQRQEMMDDAIDDVTGLEDEEEGEEVVNKVLDEIGVDLGQSVNTTVLVMLDRDSANAVASSARHRKACRARPSQKAGSHKRSVAEGATRATMNYKLGSTGCGDYAIAIRSYECEIYPQRPLLLGRLDLDTIHAHFDVTERYSGNLTRISQAKARHVQDMRVHQ